jgi:DNA-binding MarR family transcriptional regulator
MARAAAQAPGFALDSHIFYLFTQIFGRRNRSLQQRLRPFGLGVPQWRILAVLQERARCSMTELADLTTIDRTTLTRALDRLARDRLIIRSGDPRDGRSVRLALSAAGVAAYRRILPLVLEENERAVQGFDAAELAGFRALLHRMVRNLDPDYDGRNGRLTGRTGRMRGRGE